MRPVLLVTLPLLAAAIAAQGQVKSTPGNIEPLPEQRTEGGGPVNYTGHQVLRVSIANNDTVNILRSYEDRPGIQFLSEKTALDSTVDVVVSPDVRRELTDQLTSSGVKYTVNVDDVQAAIATESPQPLNGVQERMIFQRDRPVTWTAYHRLDDHHQYLDYIARNHQGLCDTFSIGTSTEGRDLKGIKCGLGRREIWMDGGIHAREWISPAVVSYLASEFSENSFGSQDILQKFTLYIIPVLNPDGYEFTHTGDRLWRKTRSRNAGSQCIGVDANRNFDIYWGKYGTSRNPCHTTYGGRRPFSEPETRAIRDFVLSHNDTLEMFITFHSYSELLFVPYAFTTEKPADYSEVRRVAEAGVEAALAVNGTRFTIPETTPQNRLSGVSDDWAKAVAGVQYTYTFELRDRGQRGFILPASEIEPSGREMVAAVKAMIRAIL